MPWPQEDANARPESISEIEDLFQKFHPRVYAYVRYRVADTAEAEDVTSEIMERALTYLSSYDSRQGTWAAWLFRIAHNTWVNHLKRQQRRNRYTTEMDETVDMISAPDPGPEKYTIAQEEAARLLQCVTRLPERQQEILSLRFAGQLSNREIARVLEMNERTVSVNILRALRKLRQQLESV